MGGRVSLTGRWAAILSSSYRASSFRNLTISFRCISVSARRSSLRDPDRVMVDFDPSTSRDLCCCFRFFSSRLSWSDLGLIAQWISRHGSLLSVAMRGADYYCYYYCCINICIYSLSPHLSSLTSFKRATFSAIAFCLSAVWAWTSLESCFLRPSTVRSRWSRCLYCSRRTSSSASVGLIDCDMYLLYSFFTDSLSSLGCWRRYRETERERKGHAQVGLYTIKSSINKNDCLGIRGKARQGQRKPDLDSFFW